MATVTDEDTRPSPGQSDWDNKVKAAAPLSAAERSVLDATANDLNGSDFDQLSQDSNLDKLRGSEAEGQPPTPLTQPEKPKDETISRKTKTLKIVKEKGPLGLIITLFGGLSIGGFSLLTPGIALVQFRSEAVKDADKLTSISEKKSALLMHKKLAGATKGACGSVITIKCRFATMSEKQVKKLESAGFKVNPPAEERSKSLLGRVKVDNLQYDTVDASGKKSVVTVDAKNFQRTLINNTEFRSMLGKAYNSRFKSVTGKVASKVMDKAGTSRDRKLTGTSDKEMRDQISSSVVNGESDVDGKKATKNAQGEWVDEQGNKYTGTDLDALNATSDGNTLNKLGKKASGSLLDKGLGAINIAGDIDQACTASKMLRLVSAASKVVKNRQLIRYAFVFLNTADSIVAGSATPEAVETASGILTHEDLRQEVVGDEGGLKTSENLDDETKKYSVTDGKQAYKPVKNPDLGKNAFDSQSYRSAAYGSVEQSTLRSQQFALGAGFTGTLYALSVQIDKVLGGGSASNSRSTCKIVQSTYVRGLGLAAGAASLFFSGGMARTAIKVGTVAAFGAATYFAISYMQTVLKDMAEGDLVNGDTEGMDAGQATIAGTRGFMGGTASSSGAQPISTEASLKQNNTVVAEVNNQLDEVARYDARETPFDIHNQYSFLGSLAMTANPILMQSSQNLASMFTFAPQILATATSSILPGAHAATPSPMARYTQCGDPSYKDINLNYADLDCSLQYGLNEDELNADPEKVADWMIENKQVVPTTGEPIMSADAQKALFNQIGSEQVSAVLDTVDTPGSTEYAKATIGTADPTAAPKVQTADTPFPPMNEGDIDYPQKDSNTQDSGEILMDTRTYAHWLRFCRFGVEGGRTVGFGDPDGLTQSVLTGLTSEEYQSTGRECLDVNACPTELNDSEQSGKGEADADKRCMPAVYKLYRAYYTLFNTNEDMDNPDEEDDSSIASGDARQLAAQLLTNENIKFTQEATKDALKTFSETGKAVNNCGKSFEIQAPLSQVILENAKKYKVLINNFGFLTDRTGAPCDDGQHPKGGAIDLNGVEELDGDKKKCEPINFQGDCVAVVDAYARDWMTNLAKAGHPTLGGVGQLNKGGFNIINNPPPGIDVVAPGNLHFDDAGGHLHIDIGDRKGR